MSSAAADGVDEVCASCGKAAIDDVKLKICTACKLVKYCSVDCQKNHRPQHKKTCKKRVAEIRDDKLFRQPEESDSGECPICCLPLPLDDGKFTLNSCCCNYICRGCFYANYLREREQGLEQRCPFCREPMPKTQEEANNMFLERVKANDPIALSKMGTRCRDEGNFEGAFEYFTKASELGNMEAHYQLSRLYKLGEGVEKDLKREMYHAEEAAIGGHPKARLHLSAHEAEKGRTDRAMKHLVTAARLGYDFALEEVKNGFAHGVVSKEDYEAALRGHQAAVDATKSEQREKAYAFYDVYNRIG